MGTQILQKANPVQPFSIQVAVKPVAQQLAPVNTTIRLVISFSWFLSFARIFDSQILK